MVAEIKASMEFNLNRDVFLHLKKIPVLSADDLSVKSDGGVVTLEGFVRSREEKRMAEKAALEVYGVKAVASDIVVKPSLERADVEIAKEIIHRFQSHILIPIEGVKAIASNGLVTLEGVVPSQFEKLLAQAAVKSVRGITGIRNNVEVRPEVVSTKVARDAGDSPSPINNRVVCAELGAAEAG